MTKNLLAHEAARMKAKLLRDSANDRALCMPPLLPQSVCLSRMFFLMDAWLSGDDVCLNALARWLEGGKAKSGYDFSARLTDDVAPLDP